MYKIVRFSREGQATYGLLKRESVFELVGNVYGNFEPGSYIAKRDELRLLCPAEPTKIVGVGLNYRGHCEEVGRQVPDVPVLFFKPPSSVVGPSDCIVYPMLANEVEFAGELAVVMKRQARRVSVPEVEECVLGYTCANDVTARDISRIDGRNTRAKSFDTFCPLGPCVATDVDPNSLVIRSRKSSGAWQEAADQDMLFTVTYLVSYISQVMTLEPGDVILTGAPKGGGTLNVGDVVEVEIEGIGTLSNRVVSPREQDHSV